MRICGGITKNHGVDETQLQGGWRVNKPLPLELGGSLSYATALSKSSHKTLTHSSPQGCAQKPREQREKRILFSPSVVAKGTRSASLCCDWIIILLLIRVVYVFSLDSFQRARELRAIQQDEINPMKASQRSPREQAGGRASRQIQGDATATGSAGQSHMAPGQTGRKTITYSLMSHPLLLSTSPPPPLPPLALPLPSTFSTS